MKKASDSSNIKLKEKKAIGCNLVFWFFILALLGMLLVLLIKIKYFK